MIYPQSPLTDNHWQLLPWFKFRQAGFPIEWLCELASSSIEDIAGGLLEAQATLPATRRAALNSLRIVLRSRSGHEHTPLDRALTGAHAFIREEELVPATILQDISCSEVSAGVFRELSTWNAQLQQFDDLLHTFARVYIQSCEHTAQQLLHRFRSERWLREVLLLSNDAHFDLFNSWLESSTATQLSNSKGRSRVDLLSRYFQRVCAKNETTAHFGPFAIGVVEPHQDSVGLRWESEGSLRRHAFYTHWAATQVARRIGLDPALHPWIRPRWNSFIFLTGRQLSVLDYSYDSSQENEVLRGLRVRFLRELTVDEVALLRACDGERTLHELFTWWQQVKSETAEETFQALLEALEQYGALVVEFEIPAGSCDTLGDLKTQLPLDCSAVAPWVQAIDSFQEALRQFAVAESLCARRNIFTALKEQFAQLTGASPERGLGQMIADRSVLFEECRRDLVGLTMGAPLAKAIEIELAPFYNLLLLVPRNRLAAEREMLNGWFASRFGEGRQVLLETFLYAFIDDGNFLESQYAAIDEKMNAISQVIADTLIPAASRQNRIVKVDATTLQDLIASYHVPIPAVCDADVMLVANSPEALQTDNFQLLVGDCHATRELLSHAASSSFMAEMYPDFACTVFKLYQAIVEDDEIVVDILRNHRAKNSAQVVLPCPDLEVNGRSPKPGRDRLHLNALYVRQTQYGLRLCTPRLDRFLRLMTAGFLGPQIRRNPFSIFSFPHHTHGLPIQGSGLRHIPRVVVNRVILQREVWRISADEFKKPVQDKHLRLSEKEGMAFLHAKKVQRAFNLPQYCFAAIPGEPKPIYVDFNAPLFARQLVLLANRVSGLIEFSEMLPGPNQLWLRDSRGCYTSELRCALFSMVENQKPPAQ